jgi:hypothetical protein
LDDAFLTHDRAPAAGYGIGCSGVLPKHNRSSRIFRRLAFMDGRAST